MLLNPQKMQIFGIPWIENEASGPTVQWPKTMSNLSNFRCQPRLGAGKTWKCKISAIYLMKRKANIFLSLDVWNITRDHKHSANF